MMQSQSQPCARASGGRQTAAVIVEFMVASPQDAEPLHDHVRCAIDRWNRAHGLRRGIMILARAAKSDVAPEIGKRAQDVPNRRLLPHAEVLIAVFWTRIGTPNGLYESGTVEEIARHSTAGKRVMIYFADLPAPPSAFDPDQIRRLFEFKNEWWAKACVRQVSRTEELEESLYADLENLMNEEEFATLGTTKLDESPASSPPCSQESEPVEAAPKLETEPPASPSDRKETQESDYESIEERAAYWLIRLDFGATEEEVTAFNEFLSENPRHLAAFLRLQVTWARADALKKLRPLDGPVDEDLLAPIKSHEGTKWGARWLQHVAAALAFWRKRQT